MERLINCVKEYSLLYDMTDKEYKDNLKKGAAWSEIAILLKLESGEAARKKWRNLRDSYVKYLKTINDPVGRSTLKYRKWPWAKQMEFLKPHITAKEATPNVLRPDVGLLVSTEYETGGNNPSVSSQLDTTPWPHDVFSEPTPPKRKRVVDKSLLSCPSNDYVHSRNTPKQEMDATDLLFLSFSRTLKAFSVQRQTSLKMKISQIMLEAEADQNNELSQLHRSRHNQAPPSSSVAPVSSAPTFSFEAFGHSHPTVSPSPSAFNKF